MMSDNLLSLFLFGLTVAVILFCFIALPKLLRGKSTKTYRIRKVHDPVLNTIRYHVEKLYTSGVWFNDNGYDSGYEIEAFREFDEAKKRYDFLTGTIKITSEVVLSNEFNEKSPSSN